MTCKICGMTTPRATLNLFDNPGHEHAGSTENKIALHFLGGAKTHVKTCGWCCKENKTN